MLVLGPALLAAKPGGRLYRMHDTHWNSAGAAVAHEAIISRLSDLLQLHRYTASDYRLQQSLPGDLARNLGDGEDRKESNPVLKRDKHCSWKAAEHEPGNNTGKIIIDRCPGKKLTALIFRDSFMNQLRPFLTPYFSQAVYISGVHDNCRFEKLVNHYAPDIIIDQRVERFLIRVPSADEIEESDSCSIPVL